MGVKSYFLGGFFFQAEDGIRDRDGWLEFRRVLFRSNRWNMLLQTVANQFLKLCYRWNMRVANSSKAFSKYGTVGTWGFKQMQIGFLILNRWNMGLQTVANQFLNIEPSEHGVANSCKSVYKYRTVGTWGSQRVANQFLNMELLEHGVANSCKWVSKYGTVGT